MEKAIVFSGPEEVAVYQKIVLKHGLMLYGRAGILPGRSWTPMKMLDAAGRVTGKKYKRGEYLLAAADIQKQLDGGVA